MCMSTTSQFRSAHSPASSGSARRAVTSLTIAAPASSAASATATLEVSIEIAVPPPASPSITGWTRCSSSSAPTAVAPGRVDSPPMSSMSAFSAASCRPCAMARSGSRKAPPSENESGVTLTIPMMRASVNSSLLLGPAQLPVRRQLDEVVRLARAVPLALVGRLVVHRLSRVVRDVGDPVGQAGEALRDAGSGAQVPPGRLRLAERDLCLVDGLLAIARADVRAAASAADDQGDEESGDEEEQDRARFHHPQYRQQSLVDALAAYRDPNCP